MTSTTLFRIVTFIAFAYAWQTSAAQGKPAYRNCDSSIHDKLVGAQFRSPNDCEVKFDLALRSAIHDAFDPALTKLGKEGWQVESETMVKPIRGIARQWQNRAYTPAFTDGGNFKLHLQLSPSTDAYQKLKKQSDDAMAEVQNNPSDPNRMKKFKENMSAMQNATDITVNIFVNESSTGVTNFTSGHLIEKVDGAAYILHLSDAQSLEGGGKDGSNNTSFIYVGKWSAPAFEKRSDGSEKVTCNTVINKSVPYLFAQNFVIRVTCNNELANQLAKSIDINKLNTILLK